MRAPSSPDARPSAALLRYEELVADALCAPDPAAAFAEAARDPLLTPVLRRMLAAASPDGVRLSALLVARLRFERLIQGSRSAAEWFEQEPAAFTRGFRRYHHAVPPRALHPGEEARDFEAWLDARAERSRPR